jgi:hypothetical protein
MTTATTKPAPSLGFTGTREGMSKAQQEALRMLLRRLRPGVFHHGDCVGADEQAHHIVRRECPACRIHVHPPEDAALRAHCRGDLLHPPKAYLQRNEAIVDAADFLFAAPEGEETNRSGTWATVRYARRREVATAVILPSGARA